MIEQIEAILRAIRVVSLVTGALVTIDSLGILIAPRESPPHRPKLSALAWLIAGAAVSGAATVFVLHRTGFVTPDDPVSDQIALVAMWAGLALAFSLRAVSRAHKPWLVAAAAAGMTIAGIGFAGWP